MKFAYHKCRGKMVSLLDDWYRLDKGVKKMAYNPVGFANTVSYVQIQSQTQTAAANDMLNYYWQSNATSCLQTQLSQWPGQQVQWPGQQVQFATVASSSNWCTQVEYAAPDPETIARWQKEAEERRVKAEVAASRAEQLLFTVIGEERQKQYAEFGHFDVPVNGRVYRVQKGRSMNVLLLENGKPTMKYCAHPSEAVPDGDTMLAQFLMLTSNEKRFLEIANKSPFHGDAGYNAVELAA